ncbi:MAG: tRNA pseudouridine(13) synthase TruD [Candidatus Micrarchaeota archaeon]|nr:tRNA pseudouridine(13) synthase TruD [Candidatus Micrarchaeota archaeon]MDE1847110.1 tRNA pseudouridine(13) synthase TruD [Candidatus Micrarchaeota archaeon]
MRYLSTTKGIGGTIKQTPEDFLVREITSSGHALELNTNYSAESLGEQQDPEGKFTTLVLQKRNWNTIQALQTVAKRVGRGIRSIGYAGLKDRASTSTQLASIFGVTPEAVLGTNVKDISINGAWRSKEGVGMGGLLGNSFSIKISDCSADEDAVKQTFDELGSKMPNYFDSQRFGIRLNNHRVGLHIMRGELEEAVMEYLTYSANENNEDARAARQRLADERDFASALSYFPQYLKSERTVLYHLSQNEKDFAKALRSIPRGVAIMFIHAVEALIFDHVVEQMLADGDFGNAKLWCGLNFYGFPDLAKAGTEKGELPLAPLIGYQTAEENIGDMERSLLEQMEIGRESFKIKSMPELSMRGSYRPILSTFRRGVESVGEGSATLDFSLPSGAYATVLVGEVTKAGGLDLRRIAPELKN